MPTLAGPYTFTTRPVNFGAVTVLLVFRGGSAKTGRSWHQNSRPDYNPWKLVGVWPKRHSYDAGDYAVAQSIMHNISAWAAGKGIAEVVMDEFGCTHGSWPMLQDNATACDEYYHYAAAAATEAGIGWAVWDDNGWFGILDRTPNGTRQWKAGVIPALFPTRS
eukprot:Hpha_TRINITY_DN15322_c1_g1::TRINITY_DN15322_c1_g1_i2::g.91466::m.91466